jgi:hypothetical protein
LSNNSYTRRHVGRVAQDSALKNSSISIEEDSRVRFAEHLNRGNDRQTGLAGRRGVEKIPVHDDGENADG